MSLTFTILGCGSSGGVPRPALGWGACDPKNPKNRRRRCSLLVEQTGAGGKTTVLVDTSPDLREQLLDASVEHIDAVLFTHEHADHTHGMDDLRSLFMRHRKRIDGYLSASTAAIVRAAFGYIFETPPGSNYPPIMNAHVIAPGQTVTINGAGGAVSAQAFLQRHGEIDSLGYRFGGVAYSSDLVDLPAESLDAVTGLDLWIVDALRQHPHPSHFSLDDALGWIDRMKPRQAILTNLHSDLDYAVLKAGLPAHIEPAYDGMRIVLGGKKT
jgi:phosphoribosyl 1,2-cyclic phosphate phosphodiesterase